MSWTHFNLVLLLSIFFAIFDKLTKEVHILSLLWLWLKQTIHPCGDYSLLVIWKKTFLLHNSWRIFFSKYLVYISPLVIMKISLERIAIIIFSTFTSNILKKMFWSIYLLLILKKTSNRAVASLRHCIADIQ